MSFKKYYHFYPTSKTIYWPVAKCGSVSIRSYFTKKENDVSDFLNNFIVNFDPLTYNRELYSFAVTRHPYDRFISAYQDVCFRAEGSKFYVKEYSNIKDLDYLINKICNTPDSEVDIHFVSQTERLALSYIQDVYDITKLSIPIRKNKSKKISIELTYTQKEKLYSRYKNDFILLGY
jgi:hypothetical protein